MAVRRKREFNWTVIKNALRVYSIEIFNFKYADGRHIGRETLLLNRTPMPRARAFRQISSEKVWVVIPGRLNETHTKELVDLIMKAARQ